MSEQTQSEQAAPSPVSETTPEQRAEMIKTQLGNVQRTKRIYQNIIQLIAQSTYRGEVAGAVQEALQHGQLMVSNLERQEHDFQFMLNPPKIPTASGGHPGPKIIQGGKGKKAKGKRK
jgi:hypothetical protein